jgi:type I restriction enzyme M protein
MQTSNHQYLVGFIWNIANKLRGPYRPPQYRRVMLPLIVLRRFDLVLAENKQKVLDEKKRLEDKGITGHALEKALSRIAAKAASRSCSTPAASPLRSCWVTHPTSRAT